MFIKLTEHINKIFHMKPAAFRKDFGWATTLFRLAKDWKNDLDKQ